MEEFGFPIDSEYLESQSFFEEDPSAPKEVLVWTESDDDIRLWMQVFVDNEKFTFKFRPASKFVSADGASGNGCSRLIKLYDTKNIIPGKQNIICLDSDFKFIAKQSTDYNGRDYAAPHFYWTHVHSKEHIFLDCDLIDDIVSISSLVPLKQLKQHTKDIYCAIAQQIYSPLTSIIFLMSLSFDKLTDEVERFKIQFREGLFILLRLKKGVVNFTACDIWKAFAIAMQELNESLTQYISDEGKEKSLASFRQNLADIGITNSNIYLFTRGHDWETVAKHLTKCHLEILQEQKFKEIKENSNDVEKEIRAFRNKIPKLDQALLSIKPRVDDFPFFEKTLKKARTIYGK